MIRRFLSTTVFWAALGVVVHAQVATDEDSTIVISDPAVRTILELPRNKPTDYISTIEALIAYGEPELAAPVVEELAALALDATQQAELVGQIGSARLTRLARNDRLPAEMQGFVSQAMAAAAEVSTSPNRIADLVRQLGDALPAKQNAAIRELSRVGQPAVGPIVDLLAREDAAQSTRSAAGRALLALRPMSEPALLAALETKQPQFKADVAELIARAGVTQAGGPLAVAALLSTGDATADARIAAAFRSMAGVDADAPAAERLLRRSIDNALRGVPVFTPAAERILLYDWSDDAATLTPVELTIADAATYHAARLARDLAALRGDQGESQRLSARLTLEANSLLADPSPWEVDLTPLSTSDLLQLLTDAKGAGQRSATLAALVEVANRRDADSLADSGGQPGPVAASLRSPSPRVRQAALNAIVAIDPPTAFAGSSYLCEAVSHALTAHGRRVAVAASPKLDAAATWVGSLASLGIEGEAEATGRALVETAVASADVEMVWVDMTIGSPGVREVVFQLRRHPATAGVPIVLVSRESQINRARQIAGEHQGVIARYRPHNEAARLGIAEDLAALLPRDWPTVDERLAAASQSAGIVKTLLANGRDFYRLRGAIARRASDIDPLVGGEQSWQTLSLLGTSGSQQTLVSLASRGTLTSEQRQQAIDALAASIDKHGLLLSTDQIQRQYDQYNQALAAEQADVALLSKILDAIELPRKRARAER